MCIAQLFLQQCYILSIPKTCSQVYGSDALELGEARPWVPGSRLWLMLGLNLLHEFHFILGPAFYSYDKWQEFKRANGNK